MEGLALEAINYLAGDNPKERAKVNEHYEKSEQRAADQRVEQDLAKSKEEGDRDRSVDSYESSESEEGSSVSDEGSLDRGRSGWDGTGGHASH